MVYGRWPDYQPQRSQVFGLPPGHWKCLHAWVPWWQQSDPCLHYFLTGFQVVVIMCIPFGHGSLDVLFVLSFLEMLMLESRKYVLRQRNISGNGTGTKTQHNSGANMITDVWMWTCKEATISTFIRATAETIKNLKLGESGRKCKDFQCKDICGEHKLKPTASRKTQNALPPTFVVQGLFGLFQFIADMTTRVSFALDVLGLLGILS